MKPFRIVESLPGNVFQRLQSAPASPLDLIDQWIGNPNIAVPKETFFEAVTQNYGERLVNHAKTCYPGLLLTENITQKELQFFMTAMAAAVQKVDLQNLFEQIRYGLDKGLRCEKFLSESEKTCIAQANEFEQLNAEQTALLLDAFQSVNRNGETTPITSLGWLPGNNFYLWQLIGNAEYANYTHQDVAATDRKMAASSEHLAKDICYSLARNVQGYDSIENNILGRIIKSVNNEGKLELYEIKSCFSEQGLVVYFLAPLTRQMWKNEETGEEIPTILTLFRGTLDLDAWDRDLNIYREGRNPGKESFEEKQFILIEELGKAVPADAVKYKNKATGHSLGGMDTQRYSKLIAGTASKDLSFYDIGSETVADPKQNLFYPFLDRLVKVEIHTWNSPRISKEDALAYNQARAATSISFEHYHNTVLKDFVQLWGGAEGVYYDFNSGVLLGYREGEETTDTTLVRYEWNHHTSITTIPGIGENHHGKNCNNRSKPLADMTVIQGAAVSDYICPRSMALATLKGLYGRGGKFFNSPLYALGITSS